MFLEKNQITFVSVFDDLSIKRSKTEKNEFRKVNFDEFENKINFKMVFTQKWSGRFQMKLVSVNQSIFWLIEISTPW